MIPKYLGIRISIDRGGTFTDIHASIPGREDIVLKLLSVDPANYKDAPTEGIRRVLELATGESLPRGQLLNLENVAALKMGTTVATNALLERKGARCALLITKGFKDLLSIGNQSRPNIFDLPVAKLGVLYENVLEIDERVTLEGPANTQRPCGFDSPAEPSVVMGVAGERVRVLQEPNMGSVELSLQQLWNEGYRSLAIACLHSYTFPKHEKMIGRAAIAMGFSVALSSDLQPMIKIVPRGMSATADAYLTPVIQTYIDSISANFQGGLGAQGTRCEFMQSDGGLVDVRGFSGLKAILSGPAAGVVGYASTCWDDTDALPIIGFDMGGTSTDVSRYDGHYAHIFDTTIAGISVQSPQLDIKTVAAGGGSMLFWRNGLFVVGPESASAHPGPACYRKGGPLTITDANLFLGRLLPEFFPKVFGPNENDALDPLVTASKFAELTAEINLEQRKKGQSVFTPEEIACGFLRVADETMSRPIRALTEARGHDTSVHNLACFGGAGGQHACSIAAALKISRIIIHKKASILSAYGLALADVVKETQEPAAALFNDSTITNFREKLEKLAVCSTDVLKEQGFHPDQIKHELYLNMRYDGSDTALMILKGDDWDFVTEFTKHHRREFGFTFEKKNIFVDDIRVRSIASSDLKSEQSLSEQMKEAQSRGVVAHPARMCEVYFTEYSGRCKTPVFFLGNLETGVQIKGPAMIIDQTQTIVLVPHATAIVLEHCVVIDLDEKRPEIPRSCTKEATIDPILLSIFAHRFMSIAEQMGHTLQNTAVSTNMKERLDFSCALFSPDGSLVANAPHVPVHLGSMQFAVRYQHNLWKGELRDGDVLVTNHPSCGGTHLPDITVITPVFNDGTLIFYVASRGHHADIGGVLPGSMPPNSTELWQEGAAIEAEKIVSGRRFNEERMIELLSHQPNQYEGCFGTRCLRDNLSDLKAQIAANTKGILLIKALIDEYGLVDVQNYMYAIQTTAEIAIRDLLKATHTKFNGAALKAVDYMDDGTPIMLKITIDGTKGEAIFDFTGTGPEVYGSTNAPEAITHSAIIYCLRSLIQSDIPLNQGCLNPINIKIPIGSILSPSKGAAVVGGNVLTSQRITDVVLTAFQACAASQGCCNNLTFGMGGKALDGGHVDGFGYYETIAGGSGAGSTWNGSSGVHTHMTNTRITDPEILEKRYPCILRQFTLREGSGGQGLHPGGDGVIRDIEFRVPVQCSILSERRSRRPHGLEGGGDGAAGLNLWIRKDQSTGEERVINLGGKNTAPFGSGDRIVVHTPGGGGWGRIER